MSQSHLEDRMGWCRGSKAASRYISVFAEEADREFARMEGVDVSEESDDEPDAPVECPRCSKETPPDSEECVWCGQALTATRAAEKSQERDETRALLEEAISGDADVDADALLTLLERLD
jgi:hypothetical protein